MSESFCFAQGHFNTYNSQNSRLSGTAKGSLAFKKLNGIRLPVLVINGSLPLKTLVIFVQDHCKLFAS